MGTTIITCTCVHEFQDERYGRGKRVANVKGSGSGCRCTVCGKDQGGTTFGKKK